MNKEFINEQNELFSNFINNLINKQYGLTLLYDNLTLCDHIFIVNDYNKNNIENLKSFIQWCQIYNICFPWVKIRYNTDVLNILLDNKQDIAKIIKVYIPELEYMQNIENIKFYKKKYSNLIFYIQYDVFPKNTNLENGHIIINSKNANYLKQWIVSNKKIDFSISVDPKINETKELITFLELYYSLIFSSQEKYEEIIFNNKYSLCNIYPNLQCTNIKSININLDNLHFKLCGKMSNRYDFGYLSKELNHLIALNVYSLIAFYSFKNVEDFVKCDLCNFQNACCRKCYFLQYEESDDILLDSPSICKIEQIRITTLIKFLLTKNIISYFNTLEENTRLQYQKELKDFYFLLAQLPKIK